MEISLGYIRLKPLGQLKTERLEIIGNHSTTRITPYQVLLPTTSLRTLALSRYINPLTLMDALRPKVGSTEVIVHPELE